MFLRNKFDNMIKRKTIKVILRRNTHRKAARQQCLLWIPNGLSLAELKPPGSKLASFPAY